MVWGKLREWLSLLRRPRGLLNLVGEPNLWNFKLKLPTFLGFTTLNSLLGKLTLKIGVQTAVDCQICLIVMRLMTVFRR